MSASHLRAWTAPARAAARAVRGLPRSGRARAVALALAATTALTPIAAAEQPPTPPAVVEAPPAPAVEHHAAADHADQTPERKGGWRAVLGGLAALGAAAGAAWMILRRGAAAKVVEPAVKAARATAAATSKVARQGASAVAGVGRSVGAWAGRKLMIAAAVVLGVLALASSVMSEISKLAPEPTLILGAALGAGATGAAVWTMRKALFRRRAGW